MVMFSFLFLFTSQVSKIAAYAYSAISQIKVDAKEELVVQFAIPWSCYLPPAVLPFQSVSPLALNLSLFLP